jgi:hypothetical protein
MKILRKLMLIAIPIAIVMAVFLKTPQSIPVGANTPYYGYITSGKRFDVSIGDAASETEISLEEKGFRYNGRTNFTPGLCRYISCKDNQIFDIYRVKQTWRHGYIYIEVKESVVTAIIWDFSLLPNIDF